MPPSYPSPSDLPGLTPLPEVPPLPPIPPLAQFDPTAGVDDPYPRPTQTRSVAVEMVEQLTLSSLRARASAEKLIHSDPELNTAAQIALYDMLEAVHTSMRVQNILLATQIQAQTSTFVMPMNFIPAVSKDMSDVE